MSNVEYNPFSDACYFAMWGVNTKEKIHFYYDESNNCRKFWLDSSKNTFNYDCRADFVLAGIASEKDTQIPFDEIKQRFCLQKNATELKSKSIFKGKDFLQCLGTKQVTALIKLISEYDLYIHYSHVNNFYYTIVEILDSIVKPEEVYTAGFDYFVLKTTFYNMLFPNIDKVTDIMIKYFYPNVETDSIEDFCNDLLNSIDTKCLQRPDELFIAEMLKRASESSEMIFIQDNEEFILQDDFSIFYVYPILTFKESIHHFDEELAIQDKIVNSITMFNGEDTNNYEFINSKDNTMVQISDLVSGLLAKMFTFINSISIDSMLATIKELNENQLINCIELNNLRLKSQRRNNGFLHSVAPIGILEKLNCFFELVCYEYICRPPHI